MKFSTEEGANKSFSTISDAERIKALEDELAGARFAAESHLNTVKLQKTIIARFTEQAPIQSAGAQLEEAAKAIYHLFEFSDAHPWVEGGNSHKQNDARRYARAALAVPATAPTVQEQTALRIKIDYRAPFGERGYMEVIAEEFTIPGVAEHHFAVHNSVDVPGEYVATHIETGFAVARGETPDFAIELARNNWTKCSPESLALKLIRAKNQSKVPRAPRAAPSIYEVQRNAAEAAISSELDSLFGPCDAAQQPTPPAAPSLTDAAIAWFEGKRPVDWAQDYHCRYPAVNCTTDREQALAKAVARHLASMSADAQSKGGA